MAPKRPFTRSSASAIATSSSKRRKHVAQKTPFTIHSSDSDSDREQSNPTSPKPSPQPTPTKSSSKDLPASWFLSTEVATQWNNGLNSRPICFCAKADKDFLISMKLPCIKHLQASSLWSLLDHPDEIAFPRLVRLFYANLEICPEPFSLKSNVKGISVEITSTSLRYLLRLFKHPDLTSRPSKQDCIRLAREEYVVSSSSQKQLTHNSLSLEAKIIFTFVSRCLLPKAHSKELLTEPLLEQIYLILHGHDIDLPNLIMTHMANVSKSPRPSALPYANLLTPIFALHDIPIQDEDIEPSNTALINEDCFARLGIVKTLKGKWILKAKKVEEPPQNVESRLESLEAAISTLGQDLTTIHCSLLDRFDALQRVLNHILRSLPNQPPVAPTMDEDRNSEDEGDAQAPAEEEEEKEEEKEKEKEKEEEKEKDEEETEKEEEKKEEEEQQDEEDEEARQPEAPQQSQEEAPFAPQDPTKNQPQEPTPQTDPRIIDSTPIDPNPLALVVYKPRP